MYIFTLSISGSIPYRYKLFRCSLDRYITVCVHTCSGTVPIHLSPLQTERTNLHRNSLFRNGPHKILGLRSDRYGMSDAFTDVDRWINTVAVPYLSKNASMDRIFDITLSSKQWIMSLLQLLTKLSVLKVFHKTTMINQDVKFPWRPLKQWPVIGRTKVCAFNQIRFLNSVKIQRMAVVNILYSLVWGPFWILYPFWQNAQRGFFQINLWTLSTNIKKFCILSILVLFKIFYIIEISLDLVIIFLQKPLQNQSDINAMPGQIVKRQMKSLTF